MRSIDLNAATWRKSSYSNSNGGACVEVSYDFLNVATWRKSSHSNPAGGECLEVSDDVLDVVPIRDSKTPTGPVLTVTAPAWAAFLGGLKAGDRRPGR